MTQKEFIERVAEKTGLSKEQAKKAVFAFIDTLREVFETEDKVAFRNFGVFYVSEKKERIGTHPQTHELIKIPAKKYLAFKPLKDVKIEY